MKGHKKKQTIERITVIGLIADKKEWIRWFYDNGYKIVHLGPKPISRYRCDTAKFKIVAEKVIG